MKRCPAVSGNLTMIQKNAHQAHISMPEVWKMVKRWREHLKVGLENRFFLIFRIPGSRVSSMPTSFKTKTGTAMYSEFTNTIKSSTLRAFILIPRMASFTLLKEPL